MMHPAVAEAAVVGIAHPQWQERPLAVVVMMPGQTASADELQQSLMPAFARWPLPDEILFVTEIPKTSVGKFSKRSLRETYANRYMARAKS